MNLSERRAKLVEPFKEVLSKLSPSQRVSLAVLAGVVTLGIALLVFTTPNEGPMVPIIDLTVNPEFVATLQAQGIPHEVGEDNWVRVPPRQFDRVKGLGIQHALDNPTEEEFAWIFRDAGWQETAGRRREKSLHSTRLALERQLEATSHIKGAAIFVHKPSSEDWSVRSSRQSATASVQIKAASTKGLTAQQATMVANLVSGAFAIDLEKITVNDDHQTHDVTNRAAFAHGEVEKRELSIEKEIREQYSQFRPEEIRVSIHLRTTAEETRIETVTYDQDKSFTQNVQKSKETRETSQPTSRAPGTETNVSAGLNQGTGGTVVPAAFKEAYSREEERGEAALSRQNSHTVIPANQDKWSNVWVSFSEVAIHEFLKEQHKIYNGEEEAYVPDKAKVDDYLQECKGIIQSYISDKEGIPGTVQVAAFFARPRPVIASAEEAGFTGFLKAYMREIVLGILALFGCFLVYRIAFSSIPQLEELPDPVAELSQFLQEREQLERDVATRRAQEVAEAEAEYEDDEDGWEIPAADQESVELLESVSSRAQGEPRVATSIVRHWLADTSASDRPREQPQ